MNACVGENENPPYDEEQDATFGIDAGPTKVLIYPPACYDGCESMGLTQEMTEGTEFDVGNYPHEDLA